MTRHARTARTKEIDCTGNPTLMRFNCETLESRRLLSANAVVGIEAITPDGASAPFGYTPTQLRHAYGFDQISFGNIVGDGSGQTVAIIDAYDHPGFVNSNDPGFVNSDLHKFDQQFGIPDPPSFTKLDEFGGTNYPSANLTWSLETAVDVEWIHAFAPKASLVLFEALSSAPGNLNNAVENARRLPNVSVVSMSFGSTEPNDLQSRYALLNAPPDHQGITFMAATGDAGAPGQAPAMSGSVLAVGGTELTIDGNSNYASETGWSGSGGGISEYQPKPAYQSSVTASATKRTIPDVAFQSAGSEGASVYTSYGNSSSAAWESVSGTSFSVLGWAGLVAVVNQGRGLAGSGTLNGATQTLPAVYSLPSSDFHDITTGNNGFAAGPGYDLVTGRGSPIVSAMVHDLVSYSSGGQISGNIFEDRSGDGSENVFEPPLTDQTVFIDTNGNGSLDAGEPSTQADSWGNFAFDGLSPGSYRLISKAKTGWSATGDGEVRNITLEPGSNQAGVNFGFQRVGNDTVSGIVFNDLNGNSLLDAGETGMAGVRVFIDVNGGGRWDSFEQSAFSRSDGSYSFTHLSKDGYSFYIEAPKGYLTTVSGRSANFSFDPQTLNVNLALTDHPYAAGHLFADANGDGINESGESTLSGWRVYDDANNDGVFDSGEKSVLSDSLGNWQIGGLSFGTHTFREILQTGYRQTAPPNGKFVADLSTLTFANGGAFGNQPISTVGGSISGTVYNDANGNAARDTGEAGISGITVYSDANNNSKLDAGEVSDITDASGAYTLSGLAAGTYKIRQILQSGWIQTTPANNFGHNVTLSANQQATGWTFGTRQNAVGGLISGTVFNDSNGDRVRNSGEAGIGGITIYNDGNNNSKLDAGEKTTVTDANGLYTLVGLAAGSYKIREILQSDWSQTTPTNNFGWTITLAANQSLSAKDFGTRSPNNPPPPTTATLSGFAFNDNNVNGTFDAGDAKTSGKTIFLDTNSNGVLDSGEKSLVTDSAANFSFTNLAAGTYHVRRVFPSGYTYSTEPIDVTIAAGQAIANLAIGSKQGTSASKTGTISGFAFNDNNKNGTFDAGDAKTSGKTIFLDTNDNGKLDSGEKSVISGSTGAFAFASLPAGTYHLRRVFPSGYTYSTALMDIIITSQGETFGNLAIGSKPIA